MSYKEKPQLKLYKYENNSFILQAIIDDYQECSFEDNLYEAGQFSITINFNIPNSQLFQRGLFVRFGSSWKFGEITRIQDKIGEDGKGSQYRIITGFDARYILKRRVIKNMNSNGLWVMTGKGEIVLRNLINDQAGTNAENKRKLPIINTIPDSENAIGKEYSASEQFSNLYEVCKTIATQSEIGWRLEFNGTNLTLVCFNGTDRTQTVQFSTSFDSLANGEFVDSSESFANAIYVGGKGQNDDRDIYEGESAIEGNSPSGLDRYESWDNQSSMTTQSEYETEALAMLNQYGQTLTMSGNGLAKCPYEYEKEYFVGDKIKIAFSGKAANAQILSVTEHWVWGNYEINFNFGKPLPDLNAQLQLMLRKIQSASNKTNSTDSVRWYTLPDETSMPKADVTYNTIGFVGNAGTGATFTLYLDNVKTGSKTYHVYLKQVSGTGKITLTTGKSGATNLVLNTGTYVAIIYVDENGNITSQGMTATSTIETGNNQPATSEGVKQVIAEEEQNRNTAISNAITGEVSARNAAITNAINELDVPSVGGDGKYISAISETNGKISATETTMDTTPTENSTKAVTSGGVKTALDSKADKVENATNGNLAGLDANGNLTDSGYKADDFVTKVLASSLPTDAVLHYSFDEVPDYPDGTADVRRENGDTYRDRSSYCANNESSGQVFKNVNGNLHCVSTIANGGVIFLRNTRNKINIVKVKVIKGTVVIGLWKDAVGPGTYTIKEFPTSAFYIIAKTSEETEWELEYVYIGDGSYSTPIIDNANGEFNATNNGGIAANEISGKGVKFLGNGYIRGNLPWTPFDKKIFSFSCWVKNWDKSEPLYLLNNWDSYAISTLYLRFGELIENKILLDSCNSDGKVHRYRNTQIDFTEYAEDMFVVANFGDNPELYINGTKIVLEEYQPPQEPIVQIQERQFFQCGRAMGESAFVYSKAEIDDFQIFDRTLSGTEVQALYQNKANTPKYYDLSDYKLKEVKENAQPQTLATSITIGGQSYTTVESALQALASLV